MFTGTLSKLAKSSDPRVPKKTMYNDDVIFMGDAMPCKCLTLNLAKCMYIILYSYGQFSRQSGYGVFES